MTRMPSQPNPRVAALGECMIELSRRADGALDTAFGGDTLNTAVYLARLGVSVDYLTALGEDRFSAEMIDAWRTEGVGTDHVFRVPGRLPGLYMVELDKSGERHFVYWRDSSPARELFIRPEAPVLAGYDTLYLSGVSLAIWGAEGRAAFFRMAEAFREIGGRIAFDTNYRPRLWPDADTARAAFDRMLKLSGLVFPGVADLRALFGDSDAETVIERCRRDGAREIVVKLDKPGALVVTADERVEVPAELVEHVVDTTAAGDSFSAGYLARRLRGASLADSARSGHRLAARVIQYPGAIIPREAMIDLMNG